VGKLADKHEGIFSRISLIPQVFWCGKGGGKIGKMPGLLPCQVLIGLIDLPHKNWPKYYDRSSEPDGFYARSEGPLLGLSLSAINAVFKRVWKCFTIQIIPASFPGLGIIVWFGKIF